MEWYCSFGHCIWERCFWWILLMEVLDWSSKCVCMTAQPGHLSFIFRFNHGILYLSNKLSSKTKTWKVHLLFLHIHSLTFCKNYSFSKFIPCQMHVLRTTRSTVSVIHPGSWSWIFVDSIYARHFTTRGKGFCTLSPGHQQISTSPKYRKHAALHTPERYWRVCLCSWHLTLQGWTSLKKHNRREREILQIFLLLIEEFRYQYCYLFIKIGKYCWSSKTQTMNGLLSWFYIHTTRDRALELFCLQIIRTSWSRRIPNFHCAIEKEIF